MVQRILKYSIETKASQQTTYINLAKDLSAMNRQLFRQARMYHIKSITVVDDDEAKYIQIGTAPDTWAMRNSVKRAYARYNEMNATVLDDQPSLKGRWSDFKPYLSATHRTAEIDGEMSVPEDMNSGKLKYGEWEFTMFESPDETTTVDGYQVGILGDHIGSAGSFSYVGLIKSYGDSRGTVNQTEPNVNTTAAMDDPLANLMDAGGTHDQIAENLIEHGDRPPYSMGAAPGEDYVGSKSNLPVEIHLCEFNTSAQADGLQRAFGLNVPLGVLRIDHQTESNSTNFTMIIELAEGKYKGIKSESLV